MPLFHIQQRKIEAESLLDDNQPLYMVILCKLESAVSRIPENGRIMKVPHA
jgi:hypothetical protein